MNSFLQPPNPSLDHNRAIPSPQTESASSANSIPFPVPESDEDLTCELTRLAGHINAAEYRFLKLLAALVERDAWGENGGMKSPAHWLNYYCGIDLGAAREKVRVARSLRHLPMIDRAFATGAISYSKVRAMTRCATPDNESQLLNVARHGTAEHMERLVRQHRRIERLNRMGETRHQARSLDSFYDEDGMLVIRGRFAPEEGALILKALEAAMEAADREKKISNAPKESSTAELSDCYESSSDDAATIDPYAKTFPRKRADALARVAEHFLATLNTTASILGNGDRYQVLVHLDARSCGDRQRIHASTPTYVEDGGAVEHHTLRRLACDASLVPVLRDGSGNVLNIGRKSRAVPTAIRRALKIRDGGCRYPGCTQTHWVDAHHIQHWCDGGETSLDNLVLLCRHHHRMLHEGLFRIETDDQLRFINSRDRRRERALCPQFPESRVKGEALEIELSNAQSGISIDPQTAVTLWQGERMDYDLALTRLMGGRRNQGISD